MNEKCLKEFLNFQGIDNLRTENFIWIGLYSIFTILFIDINFLITLNSIKYCAIVLFASVIFNVMIILFFIINFQTRKMTIPKILLFQGIVILFISLEFFALFVFKIFTNSIKFSYSYFFIILVMFAFLVLALVYRKNRLKFKNKPKSNIYVYSSLFNIGIGITIIGRFLLRSTSTNLQNEVLGFGLVILSFIFFIIASIAFQNSKVAAKYSFLK